MKRKTKIRLAVIVPALLFFSIGAWIGMNMLVARQLSLVKLFEFGEGRGVCLPVGP